MHYEITGDNLQMVTLRLAPGEIVCAEAGAMVNMSGNMQMATNMKGGLFKGLKRIATGESLFMTSSPRREGRGLSPSPGTSPGRSSRWTSLTLSSSPRRMRFSAQRRASTSISRSRRNSDRGHSAGRGSSCSGSQAGGWRSSTAAAISWR